MEITRIDTTVAQQQSYAGGERVAHDSVSETQTSSAAATRGESAAASSPERSDAELDKLMEEPIKQANKVLSGYNRQIEREVHSVTKTLMFKIKDTKTNEVIAEYPPKKIQDMIAKMWELAGLFIDQKA